MQINLKFNFQVPGLNRRVLTRLAEKGHGSLTLAAEAIRVTPSRLSNILQGFSRGCPLDHVLGLEKHLEMDLLGDDRAAIVAELREMADQIEGNLGD